MFADSGVRSTPEIRIHNASAMLKQLNTSQAETNP
jgi:hypothetical protein